MRLIRYKPLIIYETLPKTLSSSKTSVNAKLKSSPLGLTQNISQTLISQCRASCFSQGETLREQVGEPQGRTGNSLPLRFVIP
ncbi:hypothetical protein [Nostoc commune]|uniref:hypothetical protein n=1 Tax=Nostoc commune TaxID=1178 RepID=UPI0018C712BA|nr:hypothetical protein [Nostoc commune]MBG1260112.1 hypothetical protein [Nostoc commune BAE]